MMKRYIDPRDTWIDQGPWGQAVEENNILDEFYDWQLHRLFEV